MATTFNVFYLGTGPEIDTIESNYQSEHAYSLVGNTYGSLGNSLANNIEVFSPGTTGYSAGSNTAYDTENFCANDTFSINGGPDQTVDGMAQYSATITYVNGTTGSLDSVIVVQDTAGDLYLVPEYHYTRDEAALEANPIRSITLDTLVNNAFILSGDRYDAHFAVCFTSGTAIRTPRGDVEIDELRVGDLVTTLDNGPQPIRWIGRKYLDQKALATRPELKPILIRKGILGVERNLLVSPQHGMLLGPDRLARAKHLAAVPKSGVRVAHGKTSVTYIHLMFDAHQIVFAENAPSESFYPGPVAQRMVDPAALRELHRLFPDIVVTGIDRDTVKRTYGDTARGFARKNVLYAQFGPPPDRPVQRHTTLSRQSL